VLDFGLASGLIQGPEEPTHPGADNRSGLCGCTPCYMAPEVFGEPADARSDLWALG
jgi:serine/threonine protein kinase